MYSIKIKIHCDLRSSLLVLAQAYYGWTVVDISAVPQTYLALSYGFKINGDVIYGMFQGSVPAGAFLEHFSPLRSWSSSQEGKAYKI